MSEKIEIKGSCHCGAVAFAAKVTSPCAVQTCNCSICRMTGYQHLIVPANAFTLIKGQEQLAEYRFNTGTARHVFCSVCGVKSFYVPRSNPDGYSLNLRCLEIPDSVSVEVSAFDGRNWSQHAERLRHLSLD